MNKQELKSLAMKYFNLTDITDSTENNEEVKTNFAEATLADGTKITNMVEGDFEVGQELHVITEEDQHVIAPEGSHTTDSGIVITVSGEGIITGVHYPDQEGEGSLEEASKEEMSEESKEETTEEFEKESTEESTEEDKTELAEEDLAEHQEDETQMEDIREEIISAIAEVVMPEMEGLKAKLAEHEEKLVEHEEKMNEHYSKTPASESKTATSRFSKNKFKLTENEGPAHNKKRYEMALARLKNQNQ